jgi:hypothetical protein
MSTLKKPHDVGDLIGNTFSLFARRWQLFVGLQLLFGIAVVALLALAALVLAALLSSFGVLEQIETASTADLAVFGTVVTVTSIALIALGILWTAAIVSLVVGQTQSIRAAIGYARDSFWLYLRVTARVGWYVLWPMLAVVAALAALLAATSGETLTRCTPDDLGCQLATLRTVLPLAFLGFGATVAVTVWRSVQVRLAIYAPLLSQRVTTGGQAIAFSRQLIQNHWWVTFGCMLLFGLITGAISIAFGIPHAVNQSSIIGILIAQLPSLFVPVLNILFGYELYRRWSK